MGTDEGGLILSLRKKLIEVALPLEAINVASAREKSIRHGHPSTLHLWWARRPLAACRAVIFASLVDDPDDPESPPEFVEACRRLPRGKNAAENDTPRQRLFDFIERLVQWKSTTDEEMLSTARHLIRLATNGNPPPLLDPFAGGGSIPLEAQRLGLEAHASDLNPVAVMINKALIEIPPRFANMPPVNPRDRKGTAGIVGWKGAGGLAADVRYYGEWIRRRAWERIGHLYPLGPNGETVIAWLWVRTVRCPNPACGAQMPLVKSFWLGKRKGNEAWAEARIDRQSRAVQFEVQHGKGKPPAAAKTGRGASFRCLVCGEISPDQHIKNEGIAGRIDASLMAIVTEGSAGRNYHSPLPYHEQIAREASPTWIPSGEIANDTRALWCTLYGVGEFSDLFTTRQLVALDTFIDLVSEVRNQVLQDALEIGLADDNVGLSNGGLGALAYAEALSVYLAFAVSRLANRGSTICVWNTSAEKIEQVFARQAIPMTWDYPESNPFSNSTGNWHGNLDWIAEVLEWLPPSSVHGLAEQEDAVQFSSNDTFLVATDPPYYDNIGYADLSDFFYVWLRHALHDLFPTIFGTLLTPKSPELVATSYRFDNDESAANLHFEDGLYQSLAWFRIPES
jgi:putative DNA methylase